MWAKALKRRAHHPSNRDTVGGHASLCPPYKMFVAGSEARTYSSLREHHMTNILTFFSTRTLLQIVFVLGSAVAMKAWSLGLLFGG